MDYRYKTWPSAIFAVLALFTGLNSSAQSAMGTEGTEFWVAFIQNGYSAQTREIVISAEQATSGTAEAPQFGWSQAFSVAANSTTTVLVPASLEHTGSEIVSNKGIYISALDTINVYAASKQSYTGDVTSILPVANLGTDYTISTGPGLPGFSNLYKSEFAIVAIENNTEVEIIPIDTTATGRLPGIPFTINLNRGESYQLQPLKSSMDLTGSVVRGTVANGECKPFAVFAGSMCANIPLLNCAACDHLYQQLSPTNTWGFRYFTFDPGLINHYAYRVIAQENSTDVSVDGVFTITLNAGEWYDMLTVSASHCIEGNKAISVAQIFKGYACSGIGDPSHLNLNTDQQLIRATQFKTSGSTQISDHLLTIISDMANLATISVDGTPVPPSAFTAYTSCTNFGSATLSINSGQHSFDAPQGAIAYSYGVGVGESYLFSLGASSTAQLPRSDTAFCQSGALDLIAPPHFIDPYWTLQSSPSSTIHTGQMYSLTPATSTIYTAWGFKYASGCLISQDYYVELDVPSTLTVTALPATLCQNGQTQLNVGISTPPPGASINWSPGYLMNDSTLINPIATISESTWFIVEIESVTGCSKSIDSVLVEVAYPKILDVSLSTSDDSICAGGPTNLDALIEQEIIGDGFNILNNTLWNNVLGGISSDDCGSILGKALYFNGGGSRSAQTNGFDLSNGGHLRFQLKIATGVAPCNNADPGEDVVVEYSTNGGLSWNPWTGSTLDEASYPIFSLVDLAIPAAAYSINTSFRISQPSHSGAGQDNWAIDDLSISAFSANNLTLSWSPAISVSNPNSASTQATPTTSGWYVLQIQNNITGCDVLDSIYISVGPNFTLNVPNDTSLCDLAAVQLNALPSAGAGHSFSWTPNNGTLSSTSIADPIANTSTTQTYSVSAVSDHGCTANAQIAITVDQVQSVSISASDSALCAGQTSTLNATITGSSNGLSYAWTPASIMSNANIQSPVASPTSTTVVGVTVTDIASGCTYTDNLQIDVVNLNLDLGPDLILCSTAGLVLNASHTAPNPSFVWNGGTNLSSNSIQAPSVLLDSSYTYSVTLTDLAGCSASDQITITVPFDDLSPLPDVSFCEGDSVFLDATHPNSTYLWNGTDPAAAIWVTTGGTQTVQLTDQTAACQASYSVNVTMNAAPLVDLGNDSTICAGQNLILDAGNAGSTYLWSTLAPTQTITVSTAGIYWVDVTNANNCVTRDSIEIFVDQLPIVTINDSTLCIGETLTLDATWPNSTYLWNTTATTPTITVNSSGNYSVTVTTASGCSSNEAANIIFVAFPVVYLGPDTVLCDGQPLTLDAANPGMNINWNTTATSQTISPTTTGIYWVDVANGSCVSRDSIAVVFNASPIDNLIDQNGCDGDVIVLSAGNIGSTYDWNTTEVSESISVSNSGTYTVTVTNPLNCSSTFDAVVNFEMPPVVELGNDTTLCEGELLVLSTGSPSADNDWSTGQISESITVSTTGIYDVIVSTSYCEVRDTIEVIFNPSPAPLDPRELFTCLDESPRYVVIDAGNEGADHHWSTGEQTQVILAGAYGWYFVNITNSFDCAHADSVVVSEYCPSSIFVPNSFTPNGDGVNDVFIAVGNNIVELEMFIFDRWGNMLFHTDDQNIGWDGTYQGSLVKEEVYSWRIVYKLLDENDHSITGIGQESLGHVTVLK